MKKRIEKVVRFIVKTDSNLTKGEKYTEIPTMLPSSICVIGDEGNMVIRDEEYFKVVSEKEVLEFDVSEVHISNNTDIDLRGYDIKVIATPKDKTYEEMTKEELIKLLKAKE